jgi:FtsZ-binding cell division protein ZapB
MSKLCPYYGNQFCNAIELKQANEILTKFGGSVFASGSNLFAENAKLKQENEQLSESVRLLSDEYTKRLELQQENEELKEEVKRLNTINGKMDDCLVHDGKRIMMYIEICAEREEKIKQLREALRKCSPMTVDGLKLICKFCIGNTKHTDDCKYVQLTKEA